MGKVIHIAPGAQVTLFECLNRMEPEVRASFIQVLEWLSEDAAHMADTSPAEILRLVTDVLAKEGSKSAVALGTAEALLARLR